MRRIAAALTLTALVLAGCGGDDDEPTAEAGTTTEAPTDEATEDTTAPDGTTGNVPYEGEELCPYLTAAPLEHAFGVELNELYGNEAGCQYVTDDGSLSIQVVHIDIEIDPEQYAEESTETCDEGSVVEVDAGDRAYACLAIGPTASVFEGDALVNLSVLSTDDEQAVLDAFVEVLPDVTVVS